MNQVLTAAGIALPSLLVAAAVRRWYAPLRWATALLFLMMTFIFLHGAVFTSRVPVPVDEAARGYPFRGVVGEVAPRNPLTNDTAKLFLPWMQVAREELFAFRAPLWNRYQFSGYPLLANGESAPFSPLFLATLFVPLPKQIVAMAGLKIFLALLFGYLFARRQGVSEWPACLAATAFAWSVFQTVFLYYSTTAVTALLPATLFAIAIAHERGKKRDVVLVALVVGSLLANGHPESVLHIAMGVAGLLVIDLVLTGRKGDWLRRLAAPVAGVVAALALSAPAWVPVLEQVLRSSRLAELQSGTGGGAYPYGALWAMAVPNLFGNPLRQNWSWVLNYSLVASSYAGLPVLAAFAAAAISRRTGARERMWIGFVALLWVVAMGWTPLGRLASSIPPFSVTANDKLRFVAIFLGAIVAARAIDRAAEGRRLALLFCGTIAGGAALYGWAAKRTLLEPADLAGAGAVAALCVIAVARRRWLRPAAFVLVGVELLLLNGGFNALVDSRYYRPELPIVNEIRRLSPPGPFRIAGFDWMLVPNAATQYGLEDVRGSDPMSFGAYTQLLAPIVRDDRSIDFDRIVEPDHRLFDVLNVRFLLTEPGAEPGGRWREVYRGADGRLFENPSAQERFHVRRGDGDLSIRQLGPGRFRLAVDARTAVEVGSSQPAQGWVVRVRGERIRQGSGEDFFLRFELPPGVAEVDVVYAPRSYWLSVVVALVTLAGLIVTCARGVPEMME